MLRRIFLQPSCPGLQTTQSSLQNLQLGRWSLSHLLPRIHPSWRQMPNRLPRPQLQAIRCQQNQLHQVLSQVLPRFQRKMHPGQSPLQDSRLDQWSLSLLLPRLHPTGSQVRPRLSLQYGCQLCQLQQRNLPQLLSGLLQGYSGCLSAVQPSLQDQR